MNFFQKVKQVFSRGGGGKNPAPSTRSVPLVKEVAKAPLRTAEKPSRASRGDRGGDRKPRRGGSGGNSGERRPRRDAGRPSAGDGNRNAGRSRSTALPPSTEPWEVADWVVPVKDGAVRFLDLGLPPSLLRALAELNFNYCTPIQAQSLPLALDGRDVCGRAQTGTGKTAAFLLAVFKHLLETPDRPNRRKGHPRALIMSPTRELCMQIERDAEDLNRYAGLRLLAVYGGMDLPQQRAALHDRLVDVVVATPGRLLDFRQRQDIDFSDVEILVIDEADRMLDMGFIPDMRRIVYSCPPKEQRQTMLFSATLTPEVTRLAAQWMHREVTVDIEPEHVAAETIDQRVYIVTGDQKFTIVYNILRTMKPERVILFGNRRDSTERLCDNLRHQGVDAALLSGAVEQHKRVQVLDAFREGRVPVLVATDVAGRGLHIDGIDLIINYNVPEQAEDYVHRIGRTGRVGEKGISITFADELDSYYIPAIEEYMKQPLKCVQPPEEWLQPLPQDMLPRRRPRRFDDASGHGGSRPPRRGGSGPRRGGGGSRRPR